MQELKNYCDMVGIEFMSTPFDVESAEFLNDIMDVFKISSSDITNKPFIEYICSFRKPIILSTGASDLEEVHDAVNWIKPFNIPLALLHCVLNYPTPDENANLGMITALKKEFPSNIIGYSDHTLPKKMKVCEMATMLGSVIIEKHFTNDKSLPGNDHYHAMDKNDLKHFHQRMESLLELLGSDCRRPLRTEEIPRANARRSLVAARHIPQGKVIDASDLTWKRPGWGIDPREYDRVIGLKAVEQIAEDTVLTWNLLS